MKKRIYLIIYMVAILLQVHAQNESMRQVYDQAESEYQIGHIEQAKELLKEKITSFSGNLKVSAYRLLSLCSLSLDETEEAEQYVRLLLQEDPYYSISAQDPLRFADMIEVFKHGQKQTITTASKLAESVEDAPVPVTLITEDMIKMSTARTLQELLFDYVPGINIVEGEEANFAMRGMFSYSQENVLIMLNGERLNSYCTNSIAPDYRIALNNIKQIEVLRGAASSLYGNVALSAVVNIITKKGSDTDGLKASVGAGSMHTIKGDLMFGKHYINSDLLVWGSFYSSRGYRHDIAGDDPDDGYGIIPIDGYLYTNSYNHKPTYNIGGTYQWRHLNLQFNHYQGKRGHTYCSLIYPSTFDYNNYSTLDGMKPGRSVTSTNARLQYQDTWKDLSWETSLSANFETTMLYNVWGDTLSDSSIVPTIVFLDPSCPPKMTEGAFQTQKWQNYNITGMIKLAYDYDAGKIGKGNILFGAQYDYFDLYYNDFSLGDIYGRVLYTGVNNYSPLIKNNHEYNFSLYTQLKHSFNDHFILNIGLRYDHKDRYVNSAKKVLSPRVALIWKPTNKLAFKASYSRSFVDAPYFYRASSLVYTGNEDLTPQYLDNIQLTAMVKIPSLHMEYEGNIFYDNVKDIINLIDYVYTNSGVVKSIGLENTLSYNHKNWNVRGTLYMHTVIDADGLSASGNKFYSVPNLSAHLQASKMLFRNFWLMTNFSFSTKNDFKYPDYIFLNGQPIGAEVKELPSCFLADVGATYRWKFLELNVKCKNIFNHQYRLGGDRVPVLQEGRSILATLSINLTD